jgi:phasin
MWRSCLNEAATLNRNDIQIPKNDPKPPLRRGAGPRGTFHDRFLKFRAAADQARNTYRNYRNVTAQLGLLGLDTAIPEGVRALAEKTVAQTREAYDRSTDAFEASVTTFERSFDAAGQGATAFNHKIINIARRNLNSSFDLAKSLAGAKDLADIVELQAAYWRKQFGLLTAQAEEVRTLST